MTSGLFNRMIHHQSGLLGISEFSSDMRELLAREKSDLRAAQAIELFCYQAKKCIGAYAAALGGLDTLVFTGGIGENIPMIRARICDDLEFLGIEIHPNHNLVNAGNISRDGSRVTVRITRTDEEIVIARAVLQLLNSDEKTAVYT
jgi:acetate kinase